MIAELAAVLFETTLALSAAIVLVLMLRRPLRRLAGARAAYALWALLPIAAAAVLLPAPVRIVESRPEATASIASVPPVAREATVPVAPEALLLLAWFCGACAMAVVLGTRQRRFLRRLGALRRREDEGWQADGVDAGPAVVGVVPGRIVLPADFDSRYTELERDLVLRHERAHVARRDPLANVVASALRCVYWFNPMLHYAVGRFRFDQELAVDATVLAQRPDARRAYADAMLKTQLVLEPPPLGCHWQSAHPLKERILMLKQPLPGTVRFAAGVSFALLVSLSSGYVAWASQPAQVQASDPATSATAARDAGEQRDDPGHAPPRYPQDAIDRRVSGTVVLIVDVGADGLPREAELSAERSTPQVDASLVASAREAVMRWRFQPALDANGKAEAGRVLVPITFDVHGEPDAEPAPNPAPTPHAAAKPFPAATADAVSIPEPREVSGAQATAPMATYDALQPPRYPIAAVNERRAGTVMLRVLVGSDGLPEQVELEASSGSPDLDEAAIAAAREWNFDPAHDGDKAIPSWVLVPVNFSLDPPAAGRSQLDVAGDA